MSKNKKLVRTFLNRFYYYLITIEQTESAIIEIDNIDCRKRVTIKQVRKSDSSVYQVSSFTCNQIVNIKDMYVENNNIVFVYKQVNVSLRHITDILQNRSLKVFQIATICREISVNVDQFRAYYAYKQQIISGLLYMHEELSLTYNALNCSIILLNLNRRIKIDKF